MEWKWLPRIGGATGKPVVPALSPLQLKWLNDREAEGRNVRVLVGCPGGIVIYDTSFEWAYGITPKEFADRLCTKKEIAGWIEGWCT